MPPICGRGSGVAVSYALCAFLCFELALVMGATTARAQSIVLTYDTPESCPDAAWLRAEVMGRLGRDPFSEDGEIHLDVRMRRDRDGFVAEFRVEEEGEELGRRSLRAQGDDCRELASTVALTVVLVLESVAESETEVEVSGVELNPAADVTPADSGTHLAVQSDVASRSEASVLTGAQSATGHDRAIRVAAHSTESGGDTSPAPRLGFGLDLGVSLAPQPGPALALAVALVLRVDGFVARLEGRGFTDSSASFDTLTASTSWLEFALAPCARWEWMEACGVVSLGRLEARGRDLANPRDAEAWVPSVGASLRAEVGLSDWLSVGIRAELGIPLSRPQIVATDQLLWGALPVRSLISLGTTVLLPHGP